MISEIVPSARLSRVTAMAFLKSEGSLIRNSVFRSLQEEHMSYYFIFATFKSGKNLCRLERSLGKIAINSKPKVFESVSFSDILFA